MSSKFGLTLYFTPILNTPNFLNCFGGKDGKTLALDEQNLLRAIETVLFPQSKIQLIEPMERPHIWRIRTDEYPYGDSLFVDDRFIEIYEIEPPESKRPLPSSQTILKQLEELASKQILYVWGSNCLDGISQLMEWYPPTSNIDPNLKKVWQLQGMDCSGLLYYVTQGHTARNTSKLIHFGNAVPIEGKSLNEILTILRPLDIIAWKGHVVCILNAELAIESCIGHGVITTPIRNRLEEILLQRKPADSYLDNTFVVRRWHPDIKK